MKRCATVAAVLAGLMVGVVPAAAATGNGMIAIGPEDGGLQVMRADGSGAVPLFEPAGAFWDPEFSPDGNSVMFTDWPSGQPQPSIKTASLTRNDGVRQAAGVGAGEGAWSPDSKRIVYAKYVDVSPGTDRVEIHTVNPDGTGDAPVITENYPCVYREFGTGLFWNQATNRIMYLCGAEPTVTSINPDGSDRQQHGTLPTASIGSHGYFDFFDLSPDGTKLVGMYEAEIATWDWHGGAPANVTTDGFSQDDSDCCPEEWPTWAPDGTKILYADAVAGPSPLSIVSSSGGAETSIGHAGAFPHDWQPCVTGVTTTCEPTTLKGTAAGTPPDDGGGGGGGGTTTPGTTPTPADPAPPAPGPFDNTPRLTRGAAKQDGANRIVVKVGCDARSAVPCAVTVEATTAKAVASAKKRKLLAARGRVTVAPGATKKLRLKLSAKARKVLKRKGKLALNVVATTRRSDGRKVSARTKLTLKVKKKARR